MIQPFCRSEVEGWIRGGTGQGPGGRALTRTFVVGTAGLEPATSASRTLRATKLRYVPIGHDLRRQMGCDLKPPIRDGLSHRRTGPKLPGTVLTLYGSEGEAFDEFVEEGVENERNWNGDHDHGRLQ
jgi:hypothetical protein